MASYNSGDPEWPNRFFSGLDGLTYFFLRQLTPVISEIVGEKVQPTFSYFASLPSPVPELRAHRDRKQCHYAMSVFLDHPLADDLTTWPIPPRSHQTRLRPCPSASALATACSISEQRCYTTVLHWWMGIRRTGFFFGYPKASRARSTDEHTGLRLFIWTALTN